MIRKAMVITGGLIALVIVMRARGVFANDTATAANSGALVIKTLQGR